MQRGKKFRKTVVITRGKDLRLPGLAKTKGHRDRDLTPEQATQLRKIIDEELLPHCAHKLSGLAHMLGVDPSTMSKFMGERQGASLGVAMRVAFILNYEPTDMLGVPVPHGIAHHGNKKIQVAARAAALQGAPAARLRVATIEESSFDGEPGIDDYFERFTGTRRPGKGSDTAKTLKQIAGKRKPARKP